MDDKELALLMNTYKWRGWSQFDDNSHAIKEDGSTVCGVKLVGRVKLIYDNITACQECRIMIYRKHKTRFKNIK